MDGVKSLFASKTIWGAVIAATPQLGQLIGVAITGEDMSQVSEAVGNMVTAGGSLLAVYGRVKARSRIGKKMNGAGFAGD